VDVAIRRAGADDLQTARRLIEEYVDSLGIDLGFQEIDKELAEFPGAYSPPGGCVILAFAGHTPAGCVAVRAFEDDCCEMKRLYVRPAYRRYGTGRALAVAAIDAARELGYRRMRLDTQPEMDAARGLYRSLRFREIEPYRYNPTPGTAYMELDLRAETPR
jgi:ribosomal protein S18 acetylase RimI-like enzyme